MHRRHRPYWLSTGTETCLICTHAYVLQMEYRCVACDRGLCEQCAVIVRPALAVFCVECHTVEAAS
ncbi:MAG: hypothetical protein WD737_08470 [Gemmatimonadota bacterium]